MNKNKKINRAFKGIFLLLLILPNVFTLVSCKKDKTATDDGPNSIITESNEIILEQGESKKINYEFDPKGSTYDVIFISDDDSIATIENGFVKGNSVGSTKVTIICSKFSSVKKELTVNVLAKTYAINYDLDGGLLPDNYETRFNPLIGLPTLPVASKDGHKFIGWSLDDEIVDGLSAGIEKDITLKAIFNKYPTEMLIKEIKDDLYTGKSYQLEITSDKANESFTFESSNSDILTISNDGLLNCVGKGNVTITVTSTTNPNTKASITVKVLGIPESFKTANRTTELFVGSQTTFKLTASPSGSYTKVIWTSSDDSVLTIDENGSVLGIAPGVATIKGTSVVNSSVVFEREITVKEPATSVVVSASSTSAYIGEFINLNATVYPSTVSNKVKWSSSDESIATVDENGVVTIINRGEVTITASSEVTPSIKGKILIKGLHALLEEENSDVKYIICAPGTNASTSISINYHAKNTKTYIEYTVAEDINFENAQTYKPNGVYFEELSEELDGPFEARNIYSGEITGLTPGTKYIFRVNSGDGTYSDTYNFTTAKGMDDDFSFVWLTDNHYHYLQGEDTTGPEVSEEVIYRAMEMRPDLAFVFDTGDMIDTGGNSHIWDIMFKKRSTLKMLPMVSTTGNHELYVASTGQWDNRFHAAYNALPKNGVEGKVGTSCYYYYNNVLFILVENMNRSSYEAQMEWMENLLKEARYEKKAEMVIVGMHGPIQTETGADRDETMMALFEKYSVDLVLTGHYHTDEETRNYWRGERSTNDLLGVNYLIGSVSGVKGVGSNDPMVFAKGYVVDVKGTKIIVTRIDANGKVYSVREYESKKYEEISDEAKNASKEDIMNSFSYTVNQNTSVATFKWSNLAYGNVDKITFEETNRGEIKHEVIVINSAFTDALVPSIVNNQDSNILVSVYFNDGTILTKEFLIQRNTNYNLNAKLENSSIVLYMDELLDALSNIVKNFNIYVDGKLYKTVEFNGITNPINSLTLEGIDTSVNHDIKVVALNNSGKIIFENNTSYNAK